MVWSTFGIFCNRIAQSTVKRTQFANVSDSAPATAPSRASANRKSNRFLGSILMCKKKFKNTVTFYVEKVILNTYSYSADLVASLWHRSSVFCLHNQKMPLDPYGISIYRLCDHHHLSSSKYTVLYHRSPDIRSIIIRAWEFSNRANKGWSFCLTVLPAVGIHIEMDYLTSKHCTIHGDHA